MAAGNRGGFNPYHDANGRFSGPSGGGGSQINPAIRSAVGPSGGDGGSQINAALRSAAGRGGSGGSGGGGGGGGSGDSAPAIEKISPASHDLIKKAYAQIDPGAFEKDPSYDPVEASADFYGDAGGGINGVAFHMLTSLLQRGPVNPKDAAGIARNKDVAHALLRSYADAGVHPEKNLTPQKMLALYDSVLPSVQKGTFDQTRAHAIASALRMGDMGMAQTIADGGGGSGWGTTRADFRTAHGIPDDGKDG